MFPQSFCIVMDRAHLGVCVGSQPTLDCTLISYIIIISNIQNQYSMQEQSVSSILKWVNKQLHSKKLSANRIIDLKGGNLFLQILHVHFPQKINLTKIYIKPKTNFEITQVFKEFKWKPIDIEKFLYGRNLERDLVNLASYFIKMITNHSNKQNQRLSLLSARSTAKGEQNQDHNQGKNVQTNQMQQSMEDIFSQIDILACSTNSPQLKSEVDSLQSKKDKLLTKIINIEHIVRETNDPQAARALILKILDS